MDGTDSRTMQPSLGLGIFGSLFSGTPAGAHIVEREIPVACADRLISDAPPVQDSALQANGLEQASPRSRLIFPNGEQS